MRVLRITSYNVCYTKLLRPVTHRWEALRLIFFLRQGIDDRILPKPGHSDFEQVVSSDARTYHVADVFDSLYHSLGQITLDICGFIANDAGSSYNFV